MDNISDIINVDDIMGAIHDNLEVLRETAMRLQQHPERALDTSSWMDDRFRTVTPELVRHLKLKWPHQLVSRQTFRAQSQSFQRLANAADHKLHHFSTYDLPTKTSPNLALAYRLAVNSAKQGITEIVDRLPLLWKDGEDYSASWEELLEDIVENSFYIAQRTMKLAIDRFAEHR